MGRAGRGKTSRGKLIRGQMYNLVGRTDYICFPKARIFEGSRLKGLMDNARVDGVDSVFLLID